MPESLNSQIPINYVDSMRGALIRVEKLARLFEAHIDDFGNIGEIPWASRRGAIQIRGLMLLSDHLASFGPHGLEVGLHDLNKLKNEIKQSIRIKTGSEDLNSHQGEAVDAPGNALLVAPTGSGKTESGLLWAAKQAANGLRGRTFVLLPYQASMNMMQQRLIEIFFPGLAKSPDRWNDRIALVHGRSVRTAYERVLEQEDYDPSKAAQVAHIQSDLARLDVAPIRICSPYQILRLLFEPKGVEGLVQSLSQARLIFDEIHAYDPAVTALTLAATSFLTDHLGARVLFMTATLPSHLAEVLRDTFGDLGRLRVGSDILDRPARHRIEILPYDVLGANSMDRVKKAASEGSVLIVVNQVRRAIELCQAMKSSGLVNVHLLHSRFTNKDRFDIEKQLQPQRDSVLIATQTVEVSLDVSYDICFSELAPLESLLQRFGRCNRRGEQDGPAKVYIYSQFPNPAHSSYLPYEEAHLCSTLQVLKDCVAQHQGLLAEERVQSMLDSSYPEELKRELKEEIVEKSKNVMAAFGRDFVPFGAKDRSHFVQLAAQWEELFDGHEVLPESLVEKASVKTSWLGRARYLVPLSGHKFRGLGRQNKLRWCKELMCCIAEAPYTEFGLEV